MACDCIGLTDKALRDRNVKLAQTMFFDGTPSRVSITTLPIEVRRGQRVPTLIADFCPFCGAAYDAQPSPADAGAGEGQ